MSNTLLLCSALLVSIAGMACFALSIEAHRQQILGARDAAFAGARSLRVLGAALLALALVICSAADPFTMAILVWTMLLTVAAAIVAAAITWHAGANRRSP